MTVHCYRPSQWILTLVTVTSALVFFGCLACGYVLHFAPEEPYRRINGGSYTFIPAICLAVASAMTIVTLILGCFGVLKDFKFGLIVFAVCTMVVAGIQLGSTSAVFAYTMNGKVRDHVSKVMLKDLVDYSERKNANIFAKIFDNIHKDVRDHVLNVMLKDLDYSEQKKTANIFDNVQNDYNCCGVSNYSDWRVKNTTWYREEDNKKAYAPSSCCITEYQHNASCTENIKTLKQQGCLETLIDRMKIVVYPVFGFSVVLFLLEVATAQMACYGVLQIIRYQNYDVL